jgi:hypothetical protein
VLALGAGLAACPSDPADPDPDPDIGDVTIVTIALAMATQCDVYSEGVDAEGGNEEYFWEITEGALPPGLSLSVEDLTDDDVLLTGIPEVAGSFTFVLQVEDTDGNRASREFTLQVLAATRVVIQSPTLAPGLAGAAYSTQLRSCPASPTTWSVVGGTLPPGLTLSANGQLTGTPTSSDTAIVTIRAASGGFGAERTYTLQVVANRTGTFDVTAAPVVPVPAAIQPALDAALDRWEGVITGDVPQAAIPVGFFGAGQCGGFGSVLNGTSADDIIVLVNITAIDGPGATLGQAGPCVIRNPSGLPFGGVLTLDAADLAEMDTAEITDLIVHEIGHVLGFGSLWEQSDLVTTSTTDPRFVGAAAVAQWNALGGTGGVPVENTGGEGTAGSHWRETTFNRELMTGFAEQPGIFQPLSRVSIASLADLGYAVDLNAADAFALPAPMNAAAAMRDREAARGYDVVLREPIYRIDDDGNVTILRPEPR